MPDSSCQCQRFHRLDLIINCDVTEFYIIPDKRFYYTTFNINREMYEGLLKIRQDRVDQLISEQRWNDAKLIGSFVLGFAASIAIFYAAVQVAK